MKDPFSHLIIGKAMQVHRELGPGLDEHFYHELLVGRLTEANVPVESKPRRNLMHRGIVADILEADLVFPTQLVTELKCLHGAFAPEHYVQLACYLKFWNISTGLLMDFAKNSLIFQRVNFTTPPHPTLTADAWLAQLDSVPLDAETRDIAQAVGRATGNILAAHGLGYRDTTYRGLLAADLQADGIPCISSPVAQVHAGPRLLGETACHCLVVRGRIGVLVLALRESLTAADRAILQTYLRLLRLPLGVVINYGKQEFLHRWVTPPGSNLCLP
ncbi:MAG: GxxExxY protein [Limisphaerales bacterium]